MGMTPLPGDPHVVKSEAARIIDAADRMKAAAKLLASIASGGSMESDAVDELRSSASEVAIVMTKAAVRYEGTGHALAEYAPVLEAAQRQAKTAIAQLGATSVGHAREAVHRAELDPWEHVTLSEEEQSQRRVDLANAKAELAEQERAAAAALALYEDAKRDIEVAAQVAMGRIQDANESSTLNDSFWDDWNGIVDKYIAPALEFIADLADQLGDVLGMIAAVLAIIPGLQALAGALAIAAIALKAVSLLATYYLALLGKATWGDVVKKGIKLAISIVAKGAKNVPLSPIQRLLGTEERGDAASKTAGLLFKYGPEVVPGGDDEYDIDIYRAVTDPSYRNGITGGDYLAEIVTVGMDPVGYAMDEASDALGGMIDEVAPQTGPFDFSSRATHDVTPTQADFSNVSVDRIMEQNFGSSGAEPVGASRFSGGGGGGGAGGGW